MDRRMKYLVGITGVVALVAYLFWPLLNLPTQRSLPPATGFLQTHWPHVQPDNNGMQVIRSWDVTSAAKFGVDHAAIILTREKDGQTYCYVGASSGRNSYSTPLEELRYVRDVVLDVKAYATYIVDDQGRHWQLSDIDPPAKGGMCGYKLTQISH